MAKFKFYALWLSLACIFIFIIQNLFAGFTDLFLLTPSALSDFQIWRFLTSIFLHADITHLIYNLFALALFGSMLEKIIGSRKFILVFFASGIFANLVAVNFYDSSLGASGAIYGILGCLAVLKPGMMVWAFGFPMPMFIAALLWTAGSVLGIFMPSNIGHIAHLSGIAIGFLLGFIYKIILKRNRQIERKIKISEPDMRNWEARYIIEK